MCKNTDAFDARLDRLWLLEAAAQNLLSFTGERGLDLETRFLSHNLPDSEVVEMEARRALNAVLRQDKAAKEMIKANRLHAAEVKEREAT